MYCAVAAVEGDAEYTATYSTTNNTYTVTWKNADGTVLETDENVPYGTTPSYDGETPTKQADAQYTYAFAGWDPQITAETMVEGDVVYTATFTSVLRNYTITWNNYDGETLKTDQVVYGVTPVYDGDTPTKEADSQNTYEFSGWEPEISEVTGNQTYTATFDAIPVPDGGGSSGGGGNGGNHQPSGSKITVEDTDNGDVESNKDRANPGTTVKVTTTPDDGYEVDTVTVTDKDGNEIPVTDNGDGTYSFKMPASPVTVNVTFKESDGDGREPDCPSAQYKDVDPDAWYHSSVDYAIANGLMNGVASDEFAPNGALSRAMLVTILYRAEGEPEVSGENPYTDVAEGTWYSDAVKWADANGIVKGYGDGTFGPNDNITREQIAAIMMRYADYKGIDTSARADLSGYADESEISDWAYENMQWANAEGLITGRSNNMLVPQGNTTRTETAAILMRFCEKYGI